jgi:23S rRNA pseudouridine1911/1915/1917 synthase
LSVSLNVLWEDPHGLAVNKPAGWLTQGAAGGEETLETLVRRHLRPEDPASAYLGTVHRLDRPVSGVILWAKTPKAARRWAEQFARRQARKEYWAIVAPSEPNLGESGVWEDWLSRPDAQGRAAVVAPGDSASVRALTRYEIGRELAVRDGFTWLKLRPETGRTHQLRAQSTARLGPIVGDATYGSIEPFPSGIALHARSLTIEHPVSRREISIDAPVPASWAGWLLKRSGNPV